MNIGPASSSYSYLERGPSIDIENAAFIEDHYASLEGLVDLWHQIKNSQTYQNAMEYWARYVTLRDETGEVILEQV